MAISNLPKDLSGGNLTCSNHKRISWHEAKYATVWKRCLLQKSVDNFRNSWLAGNPSTCCLVAKQWKVSPIRWPLGEHVYCFMELQVEKTLEINYFFVVLVDYKQEGAYSLFNVRNIEAAEVRIRFLKPSSNFCPWQHSASNHHVEIHVYRYIKSSQKIFGIC